MLNTGLVGVGREGQKIGRNEKFSADATGLIGLASAFSADAGDGFRSPPKCRPIARFVRSFNQILPESPPKLI